MATHRPSGPPQGRGREDWPPKLSDRQRRAEIKPLEERPWYRNLRAVVAIPATVAGLVLASYGLRSNFVSQPVVEVNLQFVVDISEASQGVFGPWTKSYAASHSVEQALNKIPTGYNIGLRTFGGSCRSRGTEVVLDFKTDNIESIRGSLQQLRSKGARTLIYGILEALGSFQDTKRFAGAKKRIIVLTGGADECLHQFPSLRDAESALREAKQLTGVDAEIHFVGVGVAAVDREKLESLAGALGGKVVFASSQDDLEKVVEDIAMGAESPRSAESIRPQAPSASGFSASKPEGASGARTPVSIPSAPRQAARWFDSPIEETPRKIPRTDVGLELVPTPYKPVDDAQLQYFRSHFRFRLWCFGEQTEDRILMLWIKAPGRDERIEYRGEFPVGQGTMRVYPIRDCEVGNAWSASYQERSATYISLIFDGFLASTNYALLVVERDATMDAPEFRFVGLRTSPTRARPNAASGIR